MRTKDRDGCHVEDPRCYHRLVLLLLLFDDLRFHLTEEERSLHPDPPGLCNAA